MPTFTYTARDETGKKVSGLEEGGGKDEIVNRLQSRGWFVVTVEAGDASSERKMSQSKVRRRKTAMHNNVTSADLVVFCRQLATMLGAGITILKSLDIIAQQISSRKLYAVLQELRKNMEAGLSLHAAIAKHPKIFSDLWVNLIESGESCGNLSVVLGRLAGYLERAEEFKKKIISALIYPLILMSAGLGALFFLTVKIIPTFAEMFKGFNITLPALTQILILVSAVIRKCALIFIAVGIVAFFIFRNVIKTKQGRIMYESLLFKLPVLGEFFRALVVERFSSELATLIESGVPILYALEITEHSVGNLVMADVVRQIKEDVRDGKPLSKQLEASGFFEPMVVQMISVGEEIGELAEMFKRVNAFYEEYVGTFLVRFTSMFEPIILLFMGGVIGIMVVGMFLPIFQLSKIGGG